MDNKKFFDQYLNGNASICREERQYALFLYNILKSSAFMDRKGEKVTDILEKSGIVISGKIENVFYEAAFMRDFFERDREKLYLEFAPEKREVHNKNFEYTSDKFCTYYGRKETNFNKALIDFISQIEEPEVREQIENEYQDIKNKREKIRPVNLGHNDMFGGNNIYPCISFIARCMMNAKPDIAVLYQDNTLQFLECKFETKSQGQYRENGINLNQAYVQDLIADFLKKNHYVDEVLSTRIVNFTRYETDNILIENLIELNERILMGASLC